MDSGYVTNAGTSVDTSQGVWVDGEQVSNIYPYDANGQPLTGVQLLDDRGRPLDTGSGELGEESGEGPQPFAPSVAVDGAIRWNAYPLRERSGEPGGAPTTPPLPAPTLPALVGAPAAGPGVG